MTITAKTIEASPRGPNQPRKATVGARARAEHRHGDREHAHERQAEHGVEDEPQLTCVSAGPSSTAPNSTNVTPLSTLPSSSLNSVAGRGTTIGEAETAPATNAAMNPDPSSAAREPYARPRRRPG